MTTRKNHIKQSISLVILLLTTYVDSEKHTCSFSFEYLDGILSILNETVYNTEDTQNEKTLYWLKFVASGIEFYNNSDGIELLHSDIIIRFFINILEHIIDNNTDRIISDIE